MINKDPQFKQKHQKLPNNAHQIPYEVNNEGSNCNLYSADTSIKTFFYPMAKIYICYLSPLYFLSVSLDPTL